MSLQRTRWSSSTIPSSRRSGTRPGRSDALGEYKTPVRSPPSHCLRKQYENKRLFNPYAYCLIFWLDAHCLCPKNVFHQLPTRGKWMTLTSPKLEYSSGIFNKQGTTSSSIQTCGTLVTHRPWPCSHPCYAFQFSYPFHMFYSYFISKHLQNILAICEEYILLYVVLSILFLPQTLLCNRWVI